MDRPRGMSVRLRLTLSYAGFALLVGVLLTIIVWVILVQSLPDVGVSPDGLLIRSDILISVARWTAALLVLLLAFGLLGGWYLAGTMLAPLTRITDATRRATAGSLSDRIELAGAQDEFRDLADAFDDMLARLEAQVAGQRRFAANASHELRTPLAVSKALLEVARADREHDSDALLDRLDAVNTRAIELTEALLLLSRIDQQGFVRERVDLSLLAEEVTETLLPLAEARGISIETTGEPAATVGSPALLLQLTTNLVHNAIVHNSSESGSVQVQTSIRPGSAVLTVENTGAIITPRMASTLTEAFRRGAGRLHDHQGGTGLGLAIVQHITRSQDGTLTVVPRPAGGLRVTARFPAVDARGPDRPW